MDVQVEMLAFGQPGEIRTVTVPDAEWNAETLEGRLELVFHYGQNDFQAQPHPSVSVGDVVRLDGKRHRVAALGYDEQAT